MRVPSGASANPDSASCGSVCMAGMVTQVRAGSAAGAALLSARMHDHHHGQERAHPAGPVRTGEQRRLIIALLIALVAMLAEGIGGWLANSLALLSDAGHMLADAGAIALSLFALRIGARPADAKRTYGYYRLEILAALVNGAFLFAIAA